MATTGGGVGSDSGLIGYGASLYLRSSIISLIIIIFPDVAQTGINLSLYFVSGMEEISGILISIVYVLIILLFLKL